MKNVVSFETAKALRDAGFLIPDIQIGQVWYNDLKEPSVIVQRDHEFKTQWAGCHLGTGATGNMFKASEIKENCCFAPTATDIMSELTPICFLMKDFPVKGVVLWQGHVGAKKGVIEYRTEKYDNPHDAAAELWAYVNKK